MTVDELIEHCDRAKASGVDHLYLVIPRYSKGQRIRLCPDGGPLGHICNESDKGTVACFKASKVRAFAERLQQKGGDA